jgi:hypothetical protein
MPKQPRNWNDDAGVDPETGQQLRVCDLVGRGEEILGMRHNSERAKRWQDWWKELRDEQKGQYTRARGRRPRSRS